MDPKAVSKARARLKSANERLAEAEKAGSHDDFAGHWYLFLVSSKNVYTQLEQGAKTTAQSRQWFGAKKAIRKADPLLQYLFQARDDDEHGINDVTRFDPGGLAIGKAAPGFSNNMTISLETDHEGNLIIHELKPHDGKPILIESIPGRTVLIQVNGRGGVTYDPPTTHLGRPLVDNLPITVGRLALDYLETLAAEAEALPAYVIDR